jgi:hypothetical protein
MIACMISIGPDFTDLERAVLTVIWQMHQSDQSALTSQLAIAKVRSRENTGAGFFTNFELEDKTALTIGGQRLRNGPNVKIHGLEHGMGFILWLEGGYINSLEGYCYGPESTQQIVFSTVQFEVLPD